MKNIAIYGAGGFGRETALLVRQINEVTPRWHFVGYYDDGLRKNSIVGDGMVLGGTDDVLDLKEEIDLVVAIADPLVRKSVVGRIHLDNIKFPTLIHPKCDIDAKSNAFGKGCILTNGVILTTGVSLGDFVIVNLSSTLGHDVSLGNFATVMPGCSISGNVRIGNGCMIGTGARILQNLSLGNHCKVGAGAVVTDSFGEGKTIIGIPAHEK